MLRETIESMIALLVESRSPHQTMEASCGPLSRVERTCMLPHGDTQ